jgi:hypothetical protein
MSGKNKLIPFSKKLEKAIQEDADRCRRPFVRQVEAVLLTYYGLEDVELNKSKLEMLGELIPESNENKKAA